MSFELVNRITIKKDGVYLSSHSNNDNSPYTSHRIPSLSEVYKQEGQLGLDKEVVRMRHEYIQFRGNHPSVLRYMTLFDNEDRKAIRKEFDDITDIEYNKLSEDEKLTLWRSDTTEKAKAYNEFEERERNKMYSKMAILLPSAEDFKRELKEKQKAKTESVFS